MSINECLKFSLQFRSVTKSLFYESSSLTCITSHNTLVHHFLQHTNETLPTAHSCITSYNTLLRRFPQHTRASLSTAHSCITSHSTLVHHFPQHTPVSLPTAHSCITSQLTGFIKLSPPHSLRVSDLFSKLYKIKSC